jgi:hypothetical protein
VRFHYLPLEYLQPITLFEITGAIGMPITIDENTRNHTFGHYACVLVDINMAGFLPNSLWVEREKYSFEIEIEYENPPYFCFICNSIGHSSNHCKNDLVNKNAIEKVVTKIDPVKPKQNYVPKRIVDQVQGKRKPMAFEDPLVFDIIRSKEVTPNEFIRDLIIFEDELIPGSFVGIVPMQQVVDDLTIDLAEK